MSGFARVLLAGDTYEEALENIKDAIWLHIEDILESGELIEKLNSFSLVDDFKKMIKGKN